MKLYQHTLQEQPDFLVKSTRGVALTSALILTPFTINNFIQGRYILGLFTLMILTLCSISAWLCHNDRYHLKINLFGIAPAIIVAIVTAVHQLGIVGSYWPSLGIIAFYFILPKKPAWIVNIIFVVIITPVAWTTLDHSTAIRFFAVLLSISCFTYFSINEVYKQHYLLKKLAITDSLTGLHNRSLLQTSLENAINQSHRSNTPMSVLMFDIDYFKAINDQFGHDEGDSILKITGDFLSKSFRASDLIFRIGGEEFVAILYNTDKVNATQLAEQLREKYENLSLIPNHPVTISIGVSSLNANMDWEKWMKQADEKMYLAKRNGRNRVIA
mgnify:FL=1